MEIQRSETIGQLATALSLAQAEITAASKDNFNPGFKSKYADLASVWEACRGPLTKFGLSVIQLPSADGAKVGILTILAHKSGEFIAGELHITAEKNTPQGIVGAVTYGRRCALSAIAGIAPEDDDGESAEGRGPGDKPATKVQRNASPQQPSAPPNGKIGELAQKQVFTVMNESGKTQEQVRTVLTAFGFAKSSDITVDKFSAVLSAIREAV